MAFLEGSSHADVKRLAKNEQARERYKLNHSVIREKQNAKDRKRRIEDTDYRNKCIAKARRWKLMSMYGITPEEWQAMFENQKGCCAICNRHQSEFGRSFSVDHMHVDGFDEMPPEEKKKYVRELLCDNCNSSIGGLNDDIKLLKKAIEYLEKYNGVS